MTSLDDSVSPELMQVAEQAWLSATDDPIGDGLAAAIAAVEPLIREQIVTEIYDEHRDMACPSTLDDNGFVVYTCTHLEDAALARGVP